MGKPETFEFHFLQADERVRRAFFRAIAAEYFGLLAAVIYKAGAPPELRREGKVGLYVYGLSGLALRSPVALDNVKLHLHGKGSQKDFAQALKNGVRRVCREAGRREQNFKEIRILNSAHPLIQCADMFTGAAAERAETGHSEWLAMIQSKVSVWWEEKFEGQTKPP